MAKITITAVEYETTIKLNKKELWYVRLALATAKNQSGLWLKEGMNCPYHEIHAEISKALDAMKC